MTRLIRLFSLVLVLTALAASTVAAQALPFTKMTVSQEEYAKAIEIDDRAVLNVPCDEIVMAMNEIFKFNLKDCKALASYFRRLNVHLCPVSQKTTFARVLSSGDIDLRTFERNFKPRERCLYDNQLPKWIVSLTCGNPITGADLPAYTAAIVDVPQAEGAASGPSASPQAPTVSRDDFEAAARRAAEAAEKAEAAEREAKRAKEEFERSERRARENARRAENSNRSFLERHWKKGALISGLAVGACIAWCPPMAQATAEAKITVR